MNATSPLTEALLAAATVAIFCCGLFLLLYRIVVWARRQKKRAYIIGAALAPFIALGNVSDPDFRIVQEAKRLKNREDDNPGDPPDSDDEQLVLAAARAAAKKLSCLSMFPIAGPSNAPGMTKPHSLDCG